MDEVIVQKSKLAFNVGITGNRDITEKEKEIISRNIHSILSFVKAQVSEIYSKNKEIYASGEPVLRMISPLAEGSDRIAAKASLDARLGYQLQCPLPMKKEDYMEDFKTQASKIEFSTLISKAESIFELDFGRESIPTCYLNVGLILLEHTDLLITVWDGKARGIGGTADIIRHAEKQGIPVIWLNRNDLDRICYMYMTGRHYEDWKEKVADYLRMLLIPLEEDNNTEILKTFHNEVISPKKSVKLYSKFIELVSWTRHKEDKSSNYSSLSSQVKNSFDKDAAYYVDSYIDSYERADALALYYADIYRSAGLMRAILPFLGTLGLALGFYWNWGDATKLSIINVFGFFLQALFLFFIIELSNRNEKLKWHKKFTDYRILAEILRQLVYLAPLGYASRGIRDSGNDSPWYKWYYRNVIRSKGIPSMRLDEEKLNFYLACVRKQYIRGQVDYHNDRVAVYKRITDRFNKLGYWFFGLGIVVTVIRCFVYFLIQSGIIQKEFMGVKDTAFANMLSLLLPAVGAWFFAILGQCGFESLAQKFNAMKFQLNELDAESKYIGNSYGEVIAFILRVADIAISEVSDWRLFVKSKSIKKT